MAHCHTHRLVTFLHETRPMCEQDIVIHNLNEQALRFRYLAEKAEEELADFRAFAISENVRLLNRAQKAENALNRAIDEIRNWNGGDTLADEILGVKP